MFPRNYQYKIMADQISLFLTISIYILYLENASSLLPYFSAPVNVKEKGHYIILYIEETLHPARSFKFS